MSIKTMPLDGKMAHHGENVCVMCVSLAKSLPSGIFVPARTHPCFKMLTKEQLAQECVGGNMKRNATTEDRLAELGTELGSAPSRDRSAKEGGGKFGRGGTFAISGS